MTAIEGLGEIALRTERLPSMTACYGDGLGLGRLDDPPGETSAFFGVAAGVAGHTQILALFDRSSADGYVPPDVDRTTVDHLAFGIDPAAFDAEAERLEGAGHAVTCSYHDWVGWRSLYVHDPDGNTVELVCYDPRNARTAGDGD